MTKTLVRSLLLALPFLALQGCFIVVDDHDDDDYEPIPNAEPRVLAGEDTWWACNRSDVEDDYFWEFQAIVDDPDGLGDIESVDVFVYRAERDELLDAYGLVDEGGGVFGGIVWESESYLYCGDPVDVLFEVVDVHGAAGSLFVTYY